MESKIKIGILIVFIALIIGFFTLMPGVLTFSVINPNSVYVPRFGSVVCEETTWNTAASVSAVWLDTTEYQLGALNPDYINIPYLDSHNGKKLKVTYHCSGSYCDLDNPDPSNFTCPADFHLIYDVVVAGQLKERYESSRSGSNARFNPQAPGSTIRVGENQDVTIYASCVKGFLLDLYNKRATEIDVPFQVIKNKELVRYLDGTKVKEQGTLGCTYNTIQELALENESKNNQPVKGSLIKTVQNALGNFVTGLDTSITLPSTIPPSMNVGDSYTFVYEWKELPAYNNVLTLEDGKKVYRDAVTKTIYSVEELQLNSGSSIQVVGDVYKTNATCLSNDDCEQQTGQGWYCSQETFNCSQQTNYCNYDSDCGTAQQYVTINNLPYKIENRCVNHACSQNQTQLTCNPTKTYPYNNCPADKTVCVDNGTRCITQTTSKTACPTECCIEGDPYHYTKECTSGYACETNGTWTGTCRLIVGPTTCGDGVCDQSIENANSCSIDCGGNEPTNTCQNFWDQYREKNVLQLFGNLGTGFLGTGIFGTTPEKGCYLADWAYIAIFLFIFLIAVAAYVWKAKKK